MSIAEEIESGSATANTADILQKVSEEIYAKYKETEALAELIAKAEENLKQMKETHRRMEEEELPGMMASIGLDNIKFSTGESVSVETSIHCGIPSLRQEEAFEWLNDNNLGDLIKNEVKIKLGKKEGNMLGDVVALAEKLGLKYENKKSVHPMSLKAVVKEQMSSANPLPADLFGVYIRRVVNVKAQ